MKSIVHLFLYRLSGGCSFFVCIYVMNCLQVGIRAAYKVISLCGAPLKQEPLMMDSKSIIIRSLVEKQCEGGWISNSKMVGVTALLPAFSPFPRIIWHRISLWRLMSISCVRGRYWSYTIRIVCSYYLLFKSLEDCAWDFRCQQPHNLITKSYIWIAMLPVNWLVALILCVFLPLLFILQVGPFGSELVQSF